MALGVGGANPSYRKIVAQLAEHQFKKTLIAYSSVFI